MKNRFPLALNIALIVLVFALLFNTMAWIGSAIMFLVGRLVELILITLVLIEIFTSRKASGNVKMTWGLSYLIIGLILFFFVSRFALFAAIIVVAAIYIFGGRNKFIR